MLFRTLKNAFINPRLTFIDSKFCSSFTQVTQNNGIRAIVLDNEKTKNSLSLEMMDNLIANITKDQNDVNLRCIVLSAKGNVFSAGHNLKELTKDKGTDFHKLVFSRASELMMAIIQSPVPVIAKVDGLAAAAGCQLIATCDIVIASDRSKFSTPGANFGIFCSTPGIALARSVSRMQASYMLLTGLPVTALEAKNSGLITEVVTVEELDSKVDAICDAIKHKSRAVIELGKKFFYAQLNVDVKTAYDWGAKTMVTNLSMKDGVEGIQSFVEKRKAKWSHE